MLHQVDDISTIEELSVVIRWVENGLPDYECATFYTAILLAFLFHISIIISKSSSVNFCGEIFIK